jgi:hypothetical protein
VVHVSASSDSLRRFFMVLLVERVGRAASTRKSCTSGRVRHRDEITAAAIAAVPAPGASRAPRDPAGASCAAQSASPRAPASLAGIDHRATTRSPAGPHASSVHANSRAIARTIGVVLYFVYGARRSGLGAPPPLAR